MRGLGFAIAAIAAVAATAPGCEGCEPTVEPRPESCSLVGHEPPADKAPDLSVNNLCQVDPTNPHYGEPPDGIRQDLCTCGDYTAGFPVGVFDSGGTRGGATTCKDDDISIFSDPSNLQVWPGCATGAEVSGMMIGQHGGCCTDDDDWTLDMCPTEAAGSDGRMVATTSHIFPLLYEPIELREYPGFQSPVDMHVLGRIHVEVQGCRLYDGLFGTKTSPGSDSPFVILPTRPSGGDDVSVAGDWVRENDHAPGWTEIHEARAIATVHSVTDASHQTPGQLSFAFISAFFAERSFQSDIVALDVSVPKPTDATLNKLSCTIDPSSYVLSTPCAGYSAIPVAVTANSTSGTCHVTVLRPSSLQPHPYLCENTCQHDVPLACDPSWNKLQCNYGCTWSTVSCPVCSAATEQQCPGYPCAWDGSNCVLDDSQCGRCTGTYFAEEHFDFAELAPAEQCQQVQYAGLVRAEWTDPGDVWMCSSCACDDPSSAGAEIAAPVQGCAQEGLDPSNPADQATACAQVCAGQVCGASDACAIGSCTTPESSSATLVARGACDPTVAGPVLHVSNSGDYHATWNATRSTATLSQGGSNTVAAVSGDVYFSVDATNGILDFSNLKFSVPATEVNAVTITDPKTFELQRGIASVASNGTFIIPADTLVLGAEATVNGVKHGSSLPPLPTASSGTLSVSANSISLELNVADTSSGNAMAIHLEGVIDNHPPVAVIQGGVAECTSPVTTVTLDAGGSHDPDAGDTITHYQWFGPNAEGLGNNSTVAVPLSITQPKDVQLHVYDQKLGAAMTQVHAHLVDTQAPSLHLSLPTTCVWPPDHAMQCFALGQDVQVSVTDACDPHPTVRVASVTSNQPDNGLGDGDTAPDVSWTSNQFCIRRERATALGPRMYTVVVQAADASGNTAMQSLQLSVPEHGGCN